MCREHVAESLVSLRSFAVVSSKVVLYGWKLSQMALKWTVARARVAKNRT